MNPDVDIFAMYGGDVAFSKDAYDAISVLVDDFYCFDIPKSPEWKWKNGDHLIGHWFLERGVNLRWENLFILQWDMLVLDKPLHLLLQNYKTDQVLLSGFIEFDAVSKWWGWSRKFPDDVRQYRKYLRDNFSYEGPLYACLFIVACFPRKFLSKYAIESLTEAGFLEYKIPTMAKIYGFDIYYDKQFEPWWAANPSTKNISNRLKVLNASGIDVGLITIIKELLKPRGRRVFHPYGKSFPSLLENKFVIKLLRLIIRWFRFLFIVCFHAFES